MPRLLLLLLLPLLFASACARTSPEAGRAGDEAGFRPIFNGRDLSGWTGDTDGYAVEEGKLVCLKEKGGNIYTAQAYDDFVLRFDFRLEPGGNNGVGIRAEPGKDAAYYGMEIQILDDSSPSWANLQPWQYHGSIYGVAAARRGHLRPVGEWNSEEIVADGDRIIVRLNGAEIVNADLEEVGRPQTVDGKPHPGLFNESGHIGFLGHGHRVEFRNIRVKEL